jgi:DNA-binding transcriptional MerR regulator
VRDLTIGQAARLAGVTPKALRHYDRIGLLAPATVDPATGYRFFRAEQVDRARLIRQLRELELPLEEIRRLLALAPDRAAFGAALREHRRRIEARLTRLQRILHTIDHLVDPDVTDPDVTDPDWNAMADTVTATSTDVPHRNLAAALFNATWQLMEKEDRTPDEDALMIHRAHASLYHWLQVGRPENSARGEWQVSRVYTVLRRGEPALYHARRVLDICQRHGIGDWDLAFAYAALARAHAVAGDRVEARRWLEQARLASADITEDDNRELLLGDLETIPL